MKHLAPIIVGIALALSAFSTPTPAAPYIPQEVLEKIAGNGRKPPEPAEVVRERNELIASYTAAANALLQKGDVNGAIAQYREAIERVEGQAVPTLFWMRIGEILQQRGRLDEAATAYIEAQRANPFPTPTPSITLGDLYASQGRYEEAVAVYRKVTGPNTFAAYETYLKMALYLSHIGQNAEAIRMYRLGLGLDLPFEPHPDIPLSVTRPDRPLLAMAFQPQAFDKRLFQAVVHVALGAGEQKGGIEAAQAHFEEALRIKPNFSPAYFYHGELLRKRGQERQAEARAMYEKAMAVGRGEEVRKARQALSLLPPLPSANVGP